MIALDVGFPPRRVVARFDTGAEASVLSLPWPSLTRVPESAGNVCFVDGRCARGQWVRDRLEHRAFVVEEAHILNATGAVSVFGARGLPQLFPFYWFNRTLAFGERARPRHWTAMSASFEIRIVEINAQAFAAPKTATVDTGSDLIYLPRGNLTWACGDPLWISTEDGFTVGALDLPCDRVFFHDAAFVLGTPFLDAFESVAFTSTHLGLPSHESTAVDIALAPLVIASYAFALAIWFLCVLPKTNYELV
jgi:hypothetical protein